MPQMQTSLLPARLRFEDQSITKKVLPMVAAMQGMDEKTFLASLGPMLQMAPDAVPERGLRPAGDGRRHPLPRRPQVAHLTAKPADR